MESKQIIWWSPSLFCWTGRPASLSFCSPDRSHNQHGRHRALRGCCRHLYISGDHFTFIRVQACLLIGKDKCSFSACFLKLFTINFWAFKVPLSLGAVHFFLRWMLIKTSLSFSTSYQTYSLPILVIYFHLNGTVPQVNGMSLSIGQIIAISITATAASIGAAGIPQVNKRIWNGSGWKIMFPYSFFRLASWRWWWCSRRWDFLLRTWPSSWPSTGSSTGYRWWGWRQLDTDVHFFASLFHGTDFPCSCTLVVRWRRIEN